MNYTLATLHRPKTGNDWYVYYTFRNPETGRLGLFKQRNGINRLKSTKEKTAYGKTLVQSVNELLKEGWSPFGIDPVDEAKGKPLVELLADVLESKRPSLRARTMQSYQSSINFLRDYLIKTPEIRADKFSPSMAHGYSDYLLTRVNAKSHNNQLSHIRTFFNVLVTREIIDKTPFKNVKNKAVEQGRVLYYTPEMKVKISKHLKKVDHPMYRFCQFIYYCAIRPNELMSLQVKHIDFVNNTIFIPANIAKNKKNGIVPLNSESVNPGSKYSNFIELVHKWYKGLNPELYLFGKGLVPNAESVHRNRSSESYKLIRRKIGVHDEYENYDWKHTGGRDFIIAGGNPMELMARMRHHSLDETMTYLGSMGVTTGMKTDPKAWRFG